LIIGERVKGMENYKNAEPKDIVGKTIESITISERVVEIKFTDGDELMTTLQYVGWGGARLDNTFWPKDIESDESAQAQAGGRIGGSHE
jgi:hypothetical protein